MSDFSDLLDHAIARSNLSMLELQEASGIPVSYLYKLRKGVRFTIKYTPNVLSLIYALQCPKAEEIRLLQEFHIENIGKETFRCLHSIQEIISSIAPETFVRFHQSLMRLTLFPVPLFFPVNWRSMPVSENFCFSRLRRKKKAQC